jgi:hypothetical protein
LALVTFHPSDEIAACADESGIHDDASVCILAGYMASIGQWVAFDERWKRVLRKYDVLDFHSKEFFPVDSRGKRVGRYRKPDGSKASFGEWAEDLASAFIAELLGAISNTSIHPIGAMVDVPAFRGLTYGERKFLTGGIFSDGGG